jgi:hypothetical protein
LLRGKLTEFAEVILKFVGKVSWLEAWVNDFVFSSKASMVYSVNRPWREAILLSLQIIFRYVIFLI